MPAITNKDRLCEHIEPQSYPILVGRARSLSIRKYLFLHKGRKCAV